MTSTPLIMGIDGGGTKTVGLIVDRDGNILASRKAGPTNPNFTGLDVTAHRLAGLIRLCCREAGCRFTDLRSIVMGLAGSGDVANKRRICRAVNALLRPAGKRPLPITVENDARVALEGAFDGGEGVVVVAGTGSNVLAKTPTGQVVGAGGWGRVFGDEGSGYRIGAGALRAVAQDFDGLGEARLLRRALRENFGWESGDRIVAAVYRGSFDVSSLALTVLEAAERQDPVSLAILRENAALLADQVAAVVRKMGPHHRAGVVFIGSLARSEIYANLLRQAIRLRCPGTNFRPPLHAPAYGAALMAWSRLRLNGRGKHS